jgi:hypothetical protein
VPNRAGLSTAVFGFAVALLALPPAAPALAEEPTFFSESKPMFDNCGDGSLGKAQKEGITLGFSQNPPEAFLDEKTKQASGIDWDINKAARGDKEQDYFTDGITDDLTGEGVATDQLIRRPDPDWAIEDRFLC